MAHSRGIPNHASECILTLYPRFAKSSCSHNLAIHSIRACTARRKLARAQSVYVVWNGGRTSPPRQLPIPTWSASSEGFGALPAHTKRLSKFTRDKSWDECDAARENRSACLFHACMATVRIWEAACIQRRSVRGLVFTGLG